MVIEKKILPCGHEQNVPCHVDNSEYVCDALVDDVAPVCGHAAKKKCGQSSKEVICQNTCGMVLACGHLCPENCHRGSDPLHLNVRFR